VYAPTNTHTHTRTYTQAHCNAPESFPRAVCMCTLLQHVTTQCSTLQRTATHNVLQHITTHCNTLQRTATHYSALQHITAHCNTLQRTATYRKCKALQNTASHLDDFHAQFSRTLILNQKIQCLLNFSHFFLGFGTGCLM